MVDSINRVNIKILELTKEDGSITQELVTLKKRQKEVKSDLYAAQIRKLHIEEMYRLANTEFPRLRRENVAGLTEADVKELEKWIKRVKSNDNLRGIVEALDELKKYQPSDIHTNLYALVQKIIHGGAYSPRKRKT